MTSSRSATVPDIAQAMPDPALPHAAVRSAARGAAAYRRVLTPKQMEAEVFARATRAIRTAEAGTPLDRARACADNRRLWNVVYGLVADPTNALPSALRARIAAIATVVLRECDAQEPDLAFIAEINEQTAAGLWR